MSTEGNNVPSDNRIAGIPIIGSPSAENPYLIYDPTQKAFIYGAGGSNNEEPMDLALWMAKMEREGKTWRKTGNINSASYLEYSVPNQKRAFLAAAWVAYYTDRPLVNTFINPQTNLDYSRRVKILTANHGEGAIDHGVHGFGIESTSGRYQTATSNKLIGGMSAIGSHGDGVVKSLGVSGTNYIRFHNDNLGGNAVPLTMTMCGWIEDL